MLEIVYVLMRSVSKEKDTSCNALTLLHAPRVIRMLIAVHRKATGVTNENVSDSYILKL